jgi:hypothetical protein
LFSEDDPTASTLEATLEVGSYEILLLGGWFLEKIVDGQPVAVNAQLLSPDLQFFEIERNGESRVSYRFRVGDEIVDFGRGRLVVDIEVEEGGGGGGGNNRGNLIELSQEALGEAFFGLEETLDAALVNAGSSLSGEGAYHAIVDSYATAAAGLDVGARHCDEETLDGRGSLNGFPMDCGRLESQQFDNLDSWFPIAAVNRIDLAPQDGANCGQQRVIFANNQFVGNGRMFMILEAEIPNPEPACGVLACRPLVDFWNELSGIDDPIERGFRLTGAFLVGDPALESAGFAPFMSAERLGPQGGQIRTNNFNSSPWTLREFQFQGDINARPLPVGVAESPNGALWNDLSDLPQGEECRQGFIDSIGGLATNELGAMSFPVPEVCKDSESRNDFSQ